MSLPMASHSPLCCCFQAWSSRWFRDITTLNVSGNNVTTLIGQGLAYLPNLTELNISNNALVSIEEVLVELEKCKKLQVLTMQVGHCSVVAFFVCVLPLPLIAVVTACPCCQNAVAGDSTSTPSQYTPRVFARLRGLHRCDGIDNDSGLNAEEQTALHVLSDVRISRTLPITNPCIPSVNRTCVSLRRLLVCTPTACTPWTCRTWRWRTQLTSNSWRP